ncbi:MAG: GNAT family N-acetyltransferase [Patescibacteria group bacterium]
MSFELGEKLISLLRLRLDEKATIRELHTFGEEVGISQAGNSQHRGFGKRLIAEAERIAKKSGFEKLRIISGIGVRPYYRKLGYRLDRAKIFVEKSL